MLGVVIFKTKINIDIVESAFKEFGIGNIFQYFK